MRSRDWAGTVLVACLTVAAALLHDHTVLLAILGAVAFVCVLVIAWDVKRARTASPSWKQEVVSGLQESASRLAGEPPEDRARREARGRADRLAELHDEGRALRERVQPDRVPAHLLAFQVLRFPNVPAHQQTAACEWDRKVRGELTDAPRFLPEWDAAATLPGRRAEFGMIPALTADGRPIVAFLNTKLALLLRVVSELRDGK